MGDLKSITITPLSLIFLVMAIHSSAQKSDQAGIAKANLLLERLGGHDVWGKAKHLYVKEVVYPLTISGTVTAEFWRSYTSFDYLEKFASNEVKRQESRNNKSGWSTNNGEVSSLSEEDLMEEFAGYQQEPYSIYHRIGLRDTTLIIKLIGNNRLDFYESNGRKLCWIIVDLDNAPVSWGNVYRGRLNQHVYGPLKNFGRVNMPAWGASIDGSFRFEYVEVIPKMEGFVAPRPPITKN